MKRKKKKKVILQKDYIKEAHINRYLMVAPQAWHPNIVPMKNFFIDKSAKSGNRRLNLVMEYAKYGDVSKVISISKLISIVFEVPHDPRA